MGEPIQLEREGEIMTVYGQGQTAVHLAAGWQLAGETVEKPRPLLTDIPGVSDDLAATLTAHGFATVTAVAHATEGGLTAVSGIGKKTAPRLIQAAQELTNGR